MADFNLGVLIIYVIVLVFAISAHEAAHAWMSDKFGDDTARQLGRVTLNPVSHTDPIGTLLIPIMGFIFASMGGMVASIPLIGWGKPTPVNPLRWENKNLANVMVSGAGIMANVLIVICALIAAKIYLSSGWFHQGGMLASVEQPVGLLIDMMIRMNASLAVFNLLPFPPLDGSKILSTFLPESMQPILTTLEQYGFLILMAALYFGLFRVIFAPVDALLAYIISLM
jgi:Zn-dependent protease